MSKTIIVSNRLPVKVAEKNEELIFSTSEGGLATGLGSVYKSGGNIWIGWPGIDVTEEDKQKEITKTLAASNLQPVFLSRKEIKQYYEGFSNQILWPIFHYYASTYSNFKHSNWEYYKQVNQKFADAILESAKPGDTVWIHDYQLLLVPGMIREKLPEIAIGFFQHIPFPSYEMFRLIPWRNELIEGMLGADLIGFHTFDDASHFITAATRLSPVNSSSNIITVDERPVVVEAFPMGIDDEKYAALTHKKAVKNTVVKIENAFLDRKMILSIDRLDYSKGILQRLQAFEFVLEKHPSYIGKVTLHMIVVPSRDNVPQYKELKDFIDKKVGEINAKYRTIDWSPINYFYRSFPIETLSALYYKADICLVTPIRDGMNLVSKEYVASRTNDDGVLILSEMAGASKELSDAVIVNPSNITSMAEAIITALKMPHEEQKRRMRLMRQIVSKYNIHHWVRIFMERLREVKQLQDSMNTKQLTTATEQTIGNAYRKAKKRIIFLDYDGTLVGFKADIYTATPDKELHEIIRNLTSDPKNYVVIVSGRSYHNLEEWFGQTENLNLIAEHGAWKKKNGEWKTIPGLEDGWKKDIYPLLETYVDRTPGAFIEEKAYSLVWHYRKVEKGLGELRTNELVNNLNYLINNMSLQLLPGNKVVEIKNMDINKGKSAASLVHNKGFDFMMALGDDHTDEDIFKILPEDAYTIKVGNHISAAKYYLRSYKEVRKFLTGIVLKEPAEAI